MISDSAARRLTMVYTPIPNFILSCYIAECGLSGVQQASAQFENSTFSHLGPDLDQQAVYRLPVEPGLYSPVQQDGALEAYWGSHHFI